MPKRALPLEERYQWNPFAGGTGRYRDRQSGRFIAEKAVRADIDTYIDNRNLNIERHSQDLVDGRINVTEWQGRMREEIKDMHRTGSTVARGGHKQMTQADWGWTGPQMKKQYAYLDNFADDIISGKQPMDGRMIQRSKLYGQAARGTHEDMKRRMSAQAGFDEERRLLGAADHCGCCLEQAGMGWQPIGTLLKIGACTCTTNCHCRFIFRKSNTGETPEG